MKKKTKSFLLLSAVAVAGMYMYNKYVSDLADERLNTGNDDDMFYSWKEGNIYYRKIGNGKPLLLIHDIDSASSSDEWQKIAKKLSLTHTVYLIDLLGCGRSDKPAIQYTTYLYVQMISSFIHDVIKEKTDVVATNLSSPFVIMANQIDHEIIDNIILINPVSLKEMEILPDELSKGKMVILNLPIIGTFIYNRYYSPVKLNSNGKYLFSSIVGNYLYQDMKHALKNLDKKVLIIASSDLKENHSIVREYERNKNISSVYISGSKLYPQLDRPERILKILDNELK